MFITIRLSYSVYFLIIALLSITLFFNNYEFIYKTSNQHLEKYIPTSNSERKVFVLTYLYNLFEDNILIDEFELGVYLNTYIRTFNFTNDIYNIIKRKKYCFANFLANMLNSYNKTYLFSDYSIKYSAKGRLLNDFNILNLELEDNSNNYYDSGNSDNLLMLEWDPKINNYYTMKNLNYFMENGKEFNCLFQSSNHLIGIGALTRYDLFYDLIKENITEHNCLNPNNFFTTYRLYIKDECIDFFNIITQNKFTIKNNNFKIKYVLNNKIIYLDILEYKKLKLKYKNEKYCGKNNEKIVVERVDISSIKYEMNTKFVYSAIVLVSSTDPLIVYFNDGYYKITENNKIHIINYNNFNDYLHKEYNIDPKYIESTLKNKIKNLISTMIYLSKNSYYKDPRFYQILSFDFKFYLDNDNGSIIIRPVLYDVIHNALFTKKNYSILKDILDFQNNVIMERNKKIKLYFLNYYNIISKKISKYHSKNNKINIENLTNNISINKQKKKFKEIYNNSFEFPNKFKDFELIIDYTKKTNKYFNNINSDCF